MKFVNHFFSHGAFRATSLAVALFAAATASYADTLVVNGPTPDNAELHALGERPPGFNVADEYFAQSFTVPLTDHYLRQLDLKVNANLVDDAFGFDTTATLSFRLLITGDPETNSQSTILYESTAVSSPRTNDNSITPVTFTLPDVNLVPGQKYAFVLDSFSDMNTNDGTYGWRAFAATVAPDNYTGGSFYSYRVPRDGGHQPIGTRNDHLSSLDWVPGNAGTDMQFSMTFVTVPEPKVYMLAAGCLGLVTLYQLRKQQSLLRK